VEDSASLADFYEHAYSLQGPQAERYGRWRALGAVGKADHVIELCRRAEVEPRSTLDVGCGDGALLADLARRGFGGELHAVEISSAAAQIARGALGADAVEVFDGASLPFDDHAYDLGILSHVLEHVPEPGSLLAETARVCRAVVFEVPLEANLSARRPVKRAHATEIGHLHRLGRDGAREIAAAAGLEIAAELQDPLPLAVHRFFAAGAGARSAALARWALRAGADRLAPALARRLFTVHYAALCLAPGA
jgi:SAM-dependent methyltransferase